MEVFLLKDVEKLGKRGDRVVVRDGYGRNFLFPQALALPVTRENQARMELEKKRTSEAVARKKEEAEELARRLGSLRLQVEVVVGQKDRLFGSVTSQDLVKALEREGIPLDRKKIHLAEPIRNLGIHSVPIELYRGVKAILQVETVKKL